MVRPCVRKRFLLIWWLCGLASTYSASRRRISARAISLADRPPTGHSGHQCSHAPGRPILHLVSSSRRLGVRETGCGARHCGLPVSVQFLCSCREAVPVPACACPGRRAQGPSRLAVALGLTLLLAYAGDALTTPSTVPRSSSSGTPSHLSCRIRSCTPFFRPAQAMRGPACWRARSPTHCGAARRLAASIQGLSP